MLRQKLTLYDYQQEMVTAIRDSFAAGHRKVVAVAPTGSGKTVVFSHVARTSAERGKKILILAHMIELIEQCGEKLYFNSVDFGYLNRKYTPDPFAPVQVGTVQTVIKRLETLNFYPDLIIVDECHLVMSKTYRAILNYYQDAYVLGVTATPMRSDGKPLGDVFDVMVLGPTIQQLIDMGKLTRPVTYAPLEHIDLSDVKIVNGDYVKTMLASRMDKSGITGDAVEHYGRICPGAPAVAFCVNVKHSEHVAADFRAAGWRFEHLDGTMKDKDRRRIYKAVTSGDLHGFSSVDLATTGLDIARLQAAILLRPTPLAGLYLQMVGRVLRLAERKDRAYILDHAGCAIRHGLAQEDREWSLKQPPKKKKKRSGGATGPRMIYCTCEKCQNMYRKIESIERCPECGYINKGLAGMPSKREGELVELSLEDARRLKLSKAQEVTEAQTFEELEAIGKRNGYAPGWAKSAWASRNRKLGLF